MCEVATELFDHAYGSGPEFVCPTSNHCGRETMFECVVEFLFASIEHSSFVRVFGHCSRCKCGANDRTPVMDNSTDQLSDYEDRSAGPVQCSVGLFRRRSAVSFQQRDLLVFLARDGNVHRGLPIVVLQVWIGAGFEQCFHGLQ
jgi:hypothetical protein